MEAEVLFKLRFLSDLTEGPKGKPLFVLTEVKEESPPRYLPRLALWEEGVRFLTAEEARKPRYFAPYVYFLRADAPKEPAQLYRLDLRGGEAERLTDFTGGVLDYVLSPQGEVYLLARRERREKDQPRVYEAWPFKFDGRGRLSEEPVGLYRLGEKEPLLERYPPIKEMAFGKDGLYLVAAEDSRAQAAWRDTLYRLDGGHLLTIWGGKGPIYGLDAGEAGLVFLAHAFEYGGGTEAQLHFLPYGESPRVLAEGSFQNSLNSDLRYGAYQQGPRFGPDGAVYAVRTERGEAPLYRFSLDGGEEKVASGTVLSFAFGEGLFLLTEDFRRGVALEGPGVFFDPNEGLFPDLPEPIQTEWESPEGHRVPGYVLLPEGQGPHPLILYVHGGPHTAFGRAMMLELNLFLRSGYGVAFCNPRGSTGYGQAYALLKDWGEADERDLLGFLDHVLSRFPFDPGRVGVAGGSYGGYMVNWLTARHPDRFRAAVTDRSICNWLSFFGASDIGPRFTHLELSAKPWERPEVLWEKSPLRLVHRVRTPTLVVHSEEDHRCPIDQGETWYTALWHLGVRTRFFRVPEEGHELSRSGRPDRRVARLRAYLDWWRENL